MAPMLVHDMFIVGVCDKGSIAVTIPPSPQPLRGGFFGPAGGAALRVEGVLGRDLGRGVADLAGALAGLSSAALA